MRAPDLPVFSQDPREPGFARDPFPAYERLRALGPVAWWAELEKPVFCGMKEVSALLRDRRFGREVTHLASRESLGLPPIPARLAPFEAFEALSLLEREPPVHTRLRKLAAHAFRPRAAAGWEARARALANGLVDRLLAAPNPAGQPPDLVADYAEPLPMILMADLLGAPVEAARRMRAWSADMVAVYQAGRDRAVEDRAVAATQAFSDFMREVIARRRAAPGEALIDALIAARDAEEGALSEDELIVTAILLMNAGHEATSLSIAAALNLIFEEDLDREVFRGGVGASSQGRARAQAAVEEILRLRPPLHLFSRYALGEAEAAGLRLKLGDEVGLLLAAANRDPAVFPDPGRLDLSRANAERHVSFGAGIHFCLGAPLARMELRVALGTLLARAPDLRLAQPPRLRESWHFCGPAELRAAA